MKTLQRLRSRFNRHHLTAKILVTIICVLLAGVTLLSLWGRLWWWSELLAHFRWHYALAGLILALLALWRRWALLSGGAMALTLLNFIPLLPFYTTPTPSPPPAASVYRALALNTWEGAVSAQAMQQLVDQTEPDLIVLVEVPYGWAPAAQLSSRYPHRAQVLLEEDAARVVLSRYPLVAQPSGSADPERPSAVVQIDLPEAALTVFATHVATPMGPERWLDRNRQLATVAAVVRSQPEPVLLLGDLNNTPWTPTFTRFVQAAGLKDGRRGFGRQPTWPVSFPAPRLPLDHALVSPQMIVTNFEAGPDVGSDHLPIVVDFAFPVAGASKETSEGQ